MKQTQLFDRQCYKCGEIKPLEKFTRNRKHPTGYRFFCRDCNNKQFRDGYASNPEKYRQRTRNRVTEHPNHYKAKAAVAQALKSGTLVKEPCVKCGCLKVDAHHESYEPDQWLVVVWLCRLHHVERTIEKKKQAKEEKYRFLNQNSKVTCISKGLFREYGNKFFGEGRLDDLSERVNWPSGISVEAGFVYYHPDLFHISN